MDTILKQTLSKMDLIFYLIDAKNGLNSFDLKIKQFLIENYPDKEIIILANKCDNQDIENSILNDVYRFWDKKVIFISAIDGLNMKEVWKAIDSIVTLPMKLEYKQKLTN